MEAENQHLLQPLISSRSASSNSTSNIIFRLFLVILIGCVSIWANHEASKGFAITILNESGANTFSGKRFQLFYVSNDEATRLIIKANEAAESYLYNPDNQNFARKQVNHITLKLARSHNNSEEDTQTHVFVADPKKFVLSISPSLMEGTDFGNAMFRAVQKGMVRVWLWDGQGNAPKNLMNGIVEYITSQLLSGSDGAVRSDPSSTSACWRQDEPRAVAEFLDYCERRRLGFVARLNQAMKDGWDDAKLDDALGGLPIKNLCTTYKSLKYNYSSM